MIPSRILSPFLALAALGLESAPSVARRPQEQLRVSVQLEQRNLMIPDQSMYLMDAVAITTATTTVSNVLDNQTNRLLGSGKPIHLACSFLGIAPGGTTPGISFELFEADDAAFTVNKTSIGKVTPSVTAGTVPIDNPEIGIPARVPRRYMRVEVVTTGTNPTFTVSVFFVLDFQTNPPPVGY